MKNELARELSLAEGKHQYDNQVKRVLSNKIILAWIYYDIRFSAYLETRKECSCTVKKQATENNR